jgi:hypothetical protein
VKRVLIARSNFFFSNYINGLAGWSIPLFTKVSTKVFLPRWQILIPEMKKAHRSEP